MATKHLGPSTKPRNAKSLGESKRANTLSKTSKTSTNCAWNRKYATRGKSKTHMATACAALRVAGHIPCRWRNILSTTASRSSRVMESSKNKNNWSSARLRPAKKTTKSSPGGKEGTVSNSCLEWTRKYSRKSARRNGRATLSITGIRKLAGKRLRSDHVPPLLSEQLKQQWMMFNLKLKVEAKLNVFELSFFSSRY